MWCQLKDHGFNSQFESQFHSHSPTHSSLLLGVVYLHKEENQFAGNSFKGRNIYVKQLQGQASVPSVHECFSDWDPRGCVKMTCCHPPSESTKRTGLWSQRTRFKSQYHNFLAELASQCLWLFTDNKYCEDVSEPGFPSHLIKSCCLE